MSSVSSCSNCQADISKLLEAARQLERRAIQEKAIPGKATKTATQRTVVGLYVAGHNPTAVKVGVMVGAFVPKEWAKNLLEYSDNGVNWTFKKIPACVKSNIGKVYLMHVAWQAADQSVPVITPIVNTVELAIGFKLGVQGSNHIRELKEAGAAESSTQTKRSTAREVIDKVGVCATTYAFAHMITKGQNSAAAIAGSSASAAFPEQMKVVHTKVDAAVGKIPAEASIMMGALYAAHELYLEYFGETVPYLTEAVWGLELGASFYAGMKYYFRSERQAVASLQEDLPKIEETE